MPNEGFLVMWDVEIFLALRVFGDDVTESLFHTGKVIFAGAKTYNQIELFYRDLCKYINIDN